MQRQKKIKKEEEEEARTKMYAYLHVCPLSLLPFSCLLGIAQPFSGSPLKGVKVSLVACQLVAVQMQYVSAHHVQEVPGMGHHHEGLRPLHQIVLRSTGLTVSLWLYR